MQLVLVQDNANTTVTTAKTVAPRGLTKTNT